MDCQAAIGAVMDANPERLPLSGLASAAGADLRRSATVHDGDTPSSFFRFEGEDAEKLRPSRVAHALGEPTTGEATDVQVLNGYVVVPAHKVERRLEVEVLTTAPYPPVLPGQRADHLTPPVPAPLPLGYPPLCPLQVRLHRPQVAWVADMLAVARGEERFEPEVYTRLASGVGQRTHWHILTGECHPPVSAPIPTKRDRLDGALDRAGEKQLASPNALQV